MPPTDAPVCARTAAPARRGAKIVAALVSGRTVEAIANSEGLTRKRVETLLREELRRRWVARRRSTRACRSCGWKRWRRRWRQ